MLTHNERLSLDLLSTVVPVLRWCKFKLKYTYFIVYQHSGKLNYGGTCIAAESGEIGKSDIIISKVAEM